MLVSTQGEELHSEHLSSSISRKQIIKTICTNISVCFWGVIMMRNVIRIVPKW